MVSQKEKILLIINPISGTQSKEGIAERCLNRLDKEDVELEVLYTEAAGDARRMAAEAAAKGYLGVIAAGGDGTVNEVADGLRGSATALGIIPLGSGNGLARHLGIPMDSAGAIDVIARREIAACDSCEVNGIPFFCTFGLGFDAAVSEKFAHARQRGLITYMRSAILEYLKYKPEEYVIEADGHRFEVKAFIIAACNASQYGNNAFIAPTASIRDGLMDITIIHAGTPLTRAFVGVDLFTGFIESNMIIQTLRVREARITRKSEGVAHVDGDPVQMPAEVSLRCNEASLPIFIPGSEPEFRPLITPVKYFNRELRTRLNTLFNDD